jgi:tRNA A-37 threonylcarbamoyl transferase component Bud32
MHQKIIQQGAEALISLEQGTIKKNRIKKSYRIPEIDEQIRKLRTRSEAKLLEKAGRIIPIPKIFHVNEHAHEIVMENIQGKKLSENLDYFSEKEQKEVCKKIGENIAKLHDVEIIHGDLTTSNMIMVEENGEENKNKKTTKQRAQESLRLTKPIWRSLTEPASEQESSFKVFFIDFGLGFHSKKLEDKAVDLHVLKEALEAKHFQHWEKLFHAVIEGYKISKHHEAVLHRLKIVESRGRYKEKY